MVWSCEVRCGAAWHGAQRGSHPLMSPVRLTCWYTCERQTGTSSGVMPCNVLCVRTVLAGTSSVVMSCIFYVCTYSASWQSLHAVPALSGRVKRDLLRPYAVPWGPDSPSSCPR